MSYRRRTIVHRERSAAVGHTPYTPRGVLSASHIRPPVRTRICTSTATSPLYPRGAGPRNPSMQLRAVLSDFEGRVWGGRDRQPDTNPHTRATSKAAREHAAQRNSWACPGAIVSDGDEEDAEVHGECR